MSHRHAAVSAPRSGFAGFRFPPAVIMLAVRWYLRYGLSYRDVAELLAERGLAVDHGGASDRLNHDGPRLVRLVDVLGDQLVVAASLQVPEQVPGARRSAE
jgi:hypothetical protein